VSEPSRSAAAVSKSKPQRGKRRALKRPQVTLKAAVTLDGKLATHSGDSRWITGELSRREAHRMRARADAVLVGIGTVLADDPELTVRAVRGRNPLRVVLDAQLRTPAKTKLVRSAASTRTLIFHAADARPARLRALSKAGVELCAVRTTKLGTLVLAEVLRELHARGVEQLLVEGGARVHGAFLDAQLVDRVAVFVAPRILGDGSAPSLALGARRSRIADAWQLTAVAQRRLGDDVLITGAIARRNRKSS
jgi:diaminohydroxyphosphoribosylaminopyrimidine deaminase / 5-amino-6-(5-phosphoribosylamino)uracil reductase